MSNMCSKKQIGWYNLPEKEVFTNTFETAAWYENVEVEAGRYPMYMYDFRIASDGRVCGSVGSTVYVYMDGKVTNDYFGSLFYGVPIGTYDGKKNTGKDASASISPYDYMVAREIAEGENCRYELFPEYEVRVSSEYVDSWDGKTKRIYGIYEKEA